VLRDICLVVYREDNERADERNRNNPSPHAREVSVVGIYTFRRWVPRKNGRASCVKRARQYSLYSPRRTFFRLLADEGAMGTRSNVEHVIKALMRGGENAADALEETCVTRKCYRALNITFRNHFIA
jgi:hypothetical protein